MTLYSFINKCTRDEKGGAKMEMPPAPRFRGQPQASQMRVFVGVCIGLGLASLPLLFKEVRKREQGVS